jgi:hypothetical protein
MNRLIIKLTFHLMLEFYLLEHFKLCVQISNQIRNISLEDKKKKKENRKLKKKRPTVTWADFPKPSQSITPAPAQVLHVGPFTPLSFPFPWCGGCTG